MRIPRGATHEGMMTGKFIKLEDGTAYVWMDGEWERPRQALFMGLLSGSAVVTERGSQGYYKLTLEEIMDSFIGSPRLYGAARPFFSPEEIAASRLRAPVWPLPAGVLIVDDLA